MKTIKYLSFVAIALCMGLFAACTDGNDWETDASHNRVMAPRISAVAAGNGSLTVTFNTYGGNSFLIEANEQPFDVADLDGNTMPGSITATVTSSPGTITGLNGYTDYYVRVRALSGSKTPSHWALFGSSTIAEGQMIVTQKTTQTLGQQILNPVADADRGVNSIRVTWLAGETPTSITATYLNGDEKVVKTYELSDADRANAFFTCTELLPSTPYTIRIYKGAECVGMQTAKTLMAPPSSDYTYTVTGTTINQTLMDEIAANAKAAAAGENYAATIIIPANATVSLTTGSSGIKLPGNMTVYFFGAESSDGSKGTLQFDYALDIAGYHGGINFENLNLVCPQSSSNTYIINQGTSASVGNITFTSCNISNVNCAVIRTQKDESISIGAIIMDDCIVSNQGTQAQSYGYVITNGGSKSSIIDIEISNSTFYHCIVGIVSNNTKSDYKIDNIKMSDCTFFDCIGSGRYVADAGKNASSTLLETNMTFKNIVFGTPFHASAKGYQTNGTLTLDHFYQTAGWKFNGGTFKSNDGGLKLDWRIGQFADADLFKDAANHDFTLIHWFEQTAADEANGVQFDIYGDPRWRIDDGTDDSGDEQ